MIEKKETIIDKMYNHVVKYHTGVVEFFMIVAFILGILVGHVLTLLMLFGDM